MWTSERVDELKALWADGISATMIAGKLGGFDHCVDGGRNAVIGKVHRLDLPARRTLAKHVRQHDRRYAPGGTRYRQVVKPRLAIKRSGNGLHTYIHKRKSQAAPVIRHPVAIPEPVSLDLSIMDLKPGQCRWPHGEGPYLFCGSPTEGKSYCPYHCKAAYRPVPERRRTR